MLFNININKLETDFLLQSLIIFAIEVNLWQPFYKIHRLHANINNTQQQIQNVSRVSNFIRPIIRIIGDAAFFVRGYLVPLHDPFDCTLAVDNIFVGLRGNIGNGDLTVK